MTFDRVRFHLDEHIDPDVAKALRSHGIDVTTTIECGLRTADDAAQMDFARRERRVLVTSDDDFLRFAATNDDHAGIAFCRHTRRTLGEIVRTLILIYEVMTPEEMAGHVEFV